MASVAEFVRNMFKAKAPPASPAAAGITAADKRLVSIEGLVVGGSSAFTRFNPDELSRKQGLNVYARMRNDEQVKAVCTFKRDTILSRGWTLSYPDDSKLPEEERKGRIAIITKLINKMPGSFIDALNAVCVGREFGFSLTEKVYAQFEIDGRSWVGYGKLVARDPETFNFYTDQYGELEKCEQVAGGQRIDIDLDKFIFYVHNPEFDPYFGRSDLRAAYRSWYFKDQMIKAWGMHMERLGSGFIVAKLTTETAPKVNTKQYNDLKAALEGMRSGASVIVPMGVELDVKFPSSGAEFESVCTWHDLAIARALLVPNLLGVSHTGQTGAYSQSQTQIEAFAWTVAADKSRLEACLNDQLIRDLGDRNWGDGEYPEFSFGPISEEKLKWMVTTWQGLVGAKVVLPTEEDEEKLRKLLDMPKRDEKSTLLAETLSEFAPEPAAPPSAGSTSPGVDTKKSSTDKSTSKEKSSSSEKVKAVRAHTPDGKPRNCSTAAFSRAVERVSFAQIERRGETSTAKLRDEMASMVARTVRKLLGTSDDLKALIDEDPTDIASIEFSSADKGKLKDIVRRALTMAYTESTNIARSELRRLNMRRERATFADLRDKASDFFEANSFRMAGNVSDAARAIIQLELQNGVKYSKTPGEVRTAIWDRLVGRGLTSREAALGEETDGAVVEALNELWVDTEEQAASYLETLARTNIFEAMNEARFAEFSDPDMQDVVVAFEYSAVLDDRTTELCSYMDGRIYKSNSGVWDELRPPNHFNCRSVLVPITVDDVESGDWDGEEDSPPTVEPMEGFK